MFLKFYLVGKNISSPIIVLKIINLILFLAHLRAHLRVFKVVNNMSFVYFFK
jgi:hypothetical protein